MNTVKIVSLSVIVASSAACSQNLKFRPTMAGDPPYIGVEGRALQLELLSALKPVDKNENSVLFELCEKLRPSFQESSSRQFSQYALSGLSFGEFPFECYSYKTVSDYKDEAAMNAAVVKYVRSGMALTDYYCDNFFNRISYRAATRRFARGSVNDVGAAISAVLGLTSAGSGVTGGIGAGFGLADSSIRNYDEAFTVDADLPALQKLVWAEQDRLQAFYTDAESDGAKVPSSYPEAAIAIVRYANTCSFTGMRGLLTESMLEKANADANPLDGSRIFDFRTLSEEQRTSILSSLRVQHEELKEEEEEEEETVDVSDDTAEETG